MAIADRINEMYTHVGDVYDTITNVDLPTNKNIQNIPSTMRSSYLEIMNNGIDKIWNNWEKVTGSGTDISLSSTLEAPMKNVLNGNTYQVTTTGKNIWDLGSLSGTTQAGVTLKQDTDGGFLLNGTSTGVGRFKIALNTDINETMTLYLKSPNNSGDIMISLRNTEDIQAISMRNDNTLKVYSYTPTTPIRYIELIQLTSGVQYTNYKFYPMIVKGSYTSLTIGDYEPYTNGASPNPDYPQDIHVVSGDNSINVCGKNLFDGGDTTTTNGITFTKHSDGSYDIVGTATSAAYILNYVPLAESGIVNGETYTISSNQNLTGLEIRIESYNGNTWLRATLGGLITLPKTHSADVTGATHVRFGLFVSSGTTINLKNVKIQLEKGTTDTEYEPHQSASYLINLGVENLIDLDRTQGTYSGNGTTFEESKYYPNMVRDSGNVGSNCEMISYTSDILTIKGRYNQGVGYPIKCKPNQDYYIKTTSENSNARMFVSFYDSTGTYISGSPNNADLERQVTSPSNAYWIIPIFAVYGSSLTNVEFSNIKVLEGNKEQTISPTPIELCKIPNTTFEDRIFQATDGDSYYDSLDSATKETLDYGKWYVNKQIGKYTFTENDVSNFTIFSDVGYNANNLFTDYRKENGTINIISTKYVGIKQSASNNDFINNARGYNYAVALSPSSNYYSIKFKDTRGLSANDFGNSIIGDSVYYVLNTPTTTEITDTTLISQLETVKRSFNGQTNISQENNDKPFILDVTALKELTE